MTFNKEKCPVLRRFLGELAPFAIEELNATHMLFENQQPLVAIVKNSPHLKIIHLPFNKTCELVFKQLAISCKKLEVLDADFVACSDQYLYKTFFGGMKRELVHKSIGNNTEVPKTFQNLRGVNMWNCYPPPEQFRHSLLHVYPEIQTFTALNLHSFTPKALTSNIPTFLSTHCAVKRKPSSLQSISFESYKDFSMHPTEIADLPKQYPKITHVNLKDCPMQVNEPLQIVGEKLSKIVDKFKVNSLTICSVGFCLMDISIYQATIELTGERLHTLNLNVDNLDCGILCGMLNKCINLQEFKLSVKNSRVKLRDRELGLNPMPQLQTLHAWTDAVNDNDDFDLLLMNLINAAKNIRSLQVNSCLSKTELFYDPKSQMPKVERLSLIGTPYCEVTCTHRRVLRDYCNGLNRLIRNLPSLHTLVLYFAPSDMHFYRDLYANTGIKIVAGDKLLGQKTTQFLHYYN